MYFLKLAPLVIGLSSIISFSSFAATDNYISIGRAALTTGDYKVNGVGAKWISMDSQGSWGTMLGFDYASDSKKVDEYYLAANVELSYWDMTVGTAFRPESAKCLRIYPFIGLSVADAEVAYATTWRSGYGSETEAYFSYGIGAQLNIPTTNVFVDASYKKVNTDIDTSVTYFGLGYKF